MLDTLFGVLIPYAAFAAATYYYSRTKAGAPRAANKAGAPLNTPGKRAGVAIAAPFVAAALTGGGIVFGTLALAVWCYGLYAASLAGSAKGRGLLGEPTPNLPYQH